MRTLQYFFLSTILLLLQTTPSHGSKLLVECDDLKNICYDNPPSAFHKLCESFCLGYCVTGVEMGDIELTEIYVPIDRNLTAAIDCPGRRLYKYARLPKLSSIPPECHHKIVVDKEDREEQFRCPPTTAEKAHALSYIFGSFGPPPLFPNKTTNDTIAITERTRRQTESEDCNVIDPIDLAILIDASGSVGKETFDRTVHDVAELINNTCNDFRCSTQQMRVALATFDNNPVTVFDFAYAAANHHSRQDIVDSILTTNYTGGNTATRAGLKHMSDNIFQTEFGMRNDSKKKLLVVTDGKYNVGDDPKDMARNLFMRPGVESVEVFAIGIGRKLTLEKLRDLVYIRDFRRILPFLSYYSHSEFSKAVKLVVADAQLSEDGCSTTSVKK